MNSIKRSGRSAVSAAVAALILTAGTAVPANAEDKGRSFELYGFAQLDAIYDFQRMDPDWKDAFRPSKISVDGQYGTDGQSSVSVKQSRFGFKGVMPTSEGGTPINFKFEFDLFGTGVDAGQTTFRLRHMYGEWGSLLAGQTHTLFMDIDAFPNVYDYWGPTGMSFYRNVQVRWTPYRTDSSHFAIALERPGNDIDPGNIRLIEKYQSAEVRNNEELPDLTAQYRLNGDWGHLQLAGILRKVGYEYRVNSTDPWQSGSETGWGFDLSTAIKTVGKSQLLVSFIYGEGIASYMNDGGMDLAPSAQLAAIQPLPGALPKLQAEVVPLTGVMAYYDHWWNSKWSSSIGYSYTEVDNTNFQDAKAYHKGDYASVNLFAYPTDNVSIGGEVLWGKRTNNDGTSGEDTRVQFTVKYNFGTKF